MKKSIIWIITFHILILSCPFIVIHFTINAFQHKDAFFDDWVVFKPMMWIMDKHDKYYKNGQ